MNRSHVSFTDTLVLPTAILAGIEYAWLHDGANYTPTVLFPYLLAAAGLLAFTIALQLAIQGIVGGYNVTPFSPGVVLVLAGVVLHLAFAAPHTLPSLHWNGKLAGMLPTLTNVVAFGVGAASIAVALYHTARRSPVGFHVHGEPGRTYYANPDKIAALAGAAKSKVQHQPESKPAQSDTSGKPYRAKTPRLTFANLYGNQDLKDQLAEAGQGWRDQGKNGVLMFGPPGTGKTAFAEALAGELGIRFLSVTFGDIASKWVNQTTEQLVAVFDAALEQGPVMLFIDEIDAVLKDRRQLSAGSNEEYERMVGTFLGRATALQGSNVLLVAATNFVDRLDEAAIREGRFDFKVSVPLPDSAARWRLTAWRLRENGCTSDDGTLDRLTRRWAGFNVPRIIAVANAACELAKAEGTTVLNYDHFYRGLRKIQGRKGGAPEGAKALGDLFMEADQAQRLKEIAAQLTRVDEIEKLGGSIPIGVTCSQCGSNQLGSFVVLKHPIIGLSTTLGSIHYCHRCRTELYTTPAE
jgi:transitional endoplasmic reticulum ATPase